MLASETVIAASENILQPLVFCHDRMRTFFMESAFSTALKSASVTEPQISLLGSSTLIRITPRWLSPALDPLLPVAWPTDDTNTHPRIAERTGCLSSARLC